MLNQSKIDAFLEDVMRMMPDDVHRARAELEHNLKAALHAAFARMDLVTREEYDIQAELLSRTRALLEELEGRVQQLEDEHKQRKE
ncbi:MAG: accessory factor UbiK family protein [Gammaproteobacteria bacterium]|jgi:BMFP domain-containing protein YqiC